MTDNGIRGDNPRGIGRIISQLASIVSGIGSLPGIATDIAAIRSILETPSTGMAANLLTLLTRVSYLTGTATPSSSAFGTSLPVYLQTVLGSRAAASTEAQTVWSWLQDNSDANGRVLLGLSGNEAALPGATNILVNQLAALNSLQLVMGTLEQTPTGETIKSILQAQLVCCEEGSTPGGGGPTENPAPTGFCDTFTRVRVDAWAFVGSSTVEGTDVNIYRATWADSTLFNPLNVGVVSGSTLGVRTIWAPTNTHALYCVAWDFTGNDLPIAIGRDLGTSPSIADSAFIGTPIGGASSFTVGSIADELDRCGGASAQFSAINFAFPVGATLSKNVWLGVSNLGCPS